MFLADEWSTKKGLKLTYLLYEEHWFEPLGSLQSDDDSFTLFT